MPTSPYRAPAYGSPRDEDEDEPVQAGQDVQSEQQMDAEPVTPVQPIRLTRAFSRPQPTVETPLPRTGTTGGLVVTQAGTWDKKPEPRQRLSDDPLLREQQSIERAESQFEAKQRETNPFIFSNAVKKLADAGGRRQIERAVAIGERDYEDQLRLDRAATVDARRAEVEAQKAQNEVRLQQMLATGQKYRRDEFGNVQPILDTQGRAMFAPTKWQKAVHPKTGRPVYEMRDQFQQRQYKTPTLMDSPDPLDDNLYADFKEEGQEPYMTKAEAAASPDLNLRKMGLAALKKQRTAQATERLSGYRQAADAAQLEIETGRATEAALRQRAEAVLATNPDEYAKLLEQADAIKERVKDGGELSLQRMVAGVDLRLEQAALKRDASLIQRDELASNLIARGIDPKTSNLYSQNEGRIAEAEKDLEAARRQRQTISGLMQPVPAAPAPVAKAAQVSKVRESGKAFARGVTSEGIYAASEGGSRIFSQSPIRRGMEALEDWATEKIQGFPLTDQQKETRQKMRQRAAEKTGAAIVDRFARDYAQATNKVREDIRRALPVDQKFAQSLAGQVSQGAGQLVGTLPMAAAGAPGVAAASVGQIYDEAFQDAKRVGASDDMAHQAAMTYLPAAGLDFLGDRMVIGKVLKPLMGKMTVKQLLKDILVTGAVEGATEGGQQAYLNQVASTLAAYDPDRPFDQEVLDSVLVGAIIGGGATAAGRGARMIAQGSDAGPTEAAPVEPVAPEPVAGPEAAPIEEAPVAPVDADLEAALLASDTGITPEESIASTPEQPLQEPAVEAGSAPDTGAGVEAPVPALPAAAAEVAAMDAPSFLAWGEQVQPNLTGKAYEVGIAAIGNQPAIDALKQAHKSALGEFSATMERARTGDEQALNDAQILASKPQFFREAIEAAENTGSAATAPEVAAAHGGAIEPVAMGTVDGLATETAERPAEVAIPPPPESTPETRLADVKQRRAEMAAPLAEAPRTREQALNDAGADLPPISSLKADQKLAELRQGGITTYAGKPIEDANPAQLSNALGKFRRGELTPEGEKAQERTSDRLIKALEKAKIRKPGQLSAAAEPFSIAYDAAIDLAIVSIRAGRAVADAIKMAVARFKARYPAATDADVARLTAAIEAAGKEPPPTPSQGAPGQPTAGQTFTGPVNPSGPEFRKRSKSALGEYEYVSTTNQGQQKYAKEFADWHEANGTPESAVSEMRAINEPAMRDAIGGELLARTLERWESASVAEKPALMARAASIMGDVKAGKTEAGQALQAQAMVNRRLAPYAGLLSWMDLLRTRYETEVAPKVGEDTGAKVKRGIKEAGDEAGDAMATEISDETESPAKAARKLLKKHTIPAVDESVADRIMRMLGPLAGYRDFYTKRGTDSLAKRISDLAKTPEGEGNLWTFDSIINSELGKMLREGLDAAGLKTPKGKNLPDSERIAQFLSDDQLRADKVKVIDQKVREKIAALPEAMRQQVEEAWDATVGLVADSPSSATTARRMVQESLRADKPDWNATFKAGGIPALKSKVVNEVSTTVAAVQPGGEKLDLAPLRDMLGKTFDEIAAVKKERYDKSVALQAEREAKKKQRQEGAMGDWLIKHASSLNLLRKAAKERGLAWGDIFTGLPENQEARKQELFDRVNAEPKLKDLSDAHRKKLANNLDEAWTYLRNQIFRKEFGRLVQLPNVRKADAEKVRSVVGDLIKFSNLGILDNEAFLSAVAEKYGIERLDGPTAQKLTEIAGRLQRAKNDSERARTTIEMYEAVAKAKGVSVPDVLMSGFYSNLLNSLVTTGYAMMGGNVVQSVWNLGTLAASGRRTTSGLFAPPSPKQAAQGAAAIARGYKTGIPEGLRQALSILVTGHGGEDAAAKLVEARGEPLEMVSEGGVWPEFEAKNPKAAKAVQTAANVAKMVPRMARAIDAVFYYPAKQASLRFLTEQSLLADYPDSKVRAQKAAELLKVSPADFMAAEKKARDEGFSGLDLSMRMADILEPKSALMKIKGAAETQRYLTDQQRAAQAQGIGDPLMKEGTRFAAKTTLSQEPEGWAGVFYDGFSKTVENVRPAGFPVLKLLFPFLRLPTNFYNANLASTPFGAGAMAIGDTPTMQKKDGKRVRRQLTDTERGQLYMQSLIGSASMLYFALQAMQADPDDPEAFDITANGPADRTLRRQMEQSGWKAKSIRIPGTDTWVDYMNTPMAMPLAIAGHIADAYKYQKTEDELVMGSAMLDASVRFPSIMFGLPALSGMQDLGELLDEENVDAKKVSRFLSRSAKNFVRPRLIDEVDRIFDPAVKDDGVIRYDELGDPVERSPLSRVAKTTTDDPLRRTLLDRKLKIPTAGRETKLRNVRMTAEQAAEYAALPADQKAAYKSRVENPTMTAEQYSEYMRISGARIKAKLTPLVPLLKTLPADKAQDKIDSVTDDARREAREILRRSALTPVSTK